MWNPLWSLTILNMLDGLSGAKRMEEEMEAHGLVPDGLSYSIFSYGHLRCGDDEMRGYGVYLKKQPENV